MDEMIVFREILRNFAKFGDLLLGNLVGYLKWAELGFNAKGSVCYDNKPAYCDKCGRLYDWNTAMKACPKGWHLPSYGEWDILISSVGDSETAGKFLKATSGWNSYSSSVNGLDTYGFSALPCGLSKGYFSWVGEAGFWWTAKEYKDSSASNQSMYYHSNYTDGYKNWSKQEKTNLFSVRCIKDD
jgi:uncharacterized protein (TIGR02145 family)